MNKIMFMTIGKRDCHLIYETAQGGRYRWSANVELVKEHKKLPILDARDIKEDKPQGSRDKVIGLCFPMLSKALDYLVNRGETKLDYLFLISTNRKLLLPKLMQIKELLDQAGVIDNTYEYLEKGLIKHAKEDTISDTAHFIKRSLEHKKIPLYCISIAHIEVLDLGTYGFFDSIIQADLSKPLEINLLKRADINVLDFFESETFVALKPYFAHLEEAKIYLATNSGGMPQMQKGVEQVLRSAVAHADYEQVFCSEYLWYQLESQPQEEFLLLLRQMTDNVVSLDWDSAYARFVVIKSKHTSKLGKDKLDKLESLFRSIAKQRAATQKEQWFENFSSLILQALYRMNLNDVVVWLKCMEEAAFDALLNKQCGKLWQRVETIKDEKGNKKKHVIIKDNASGKLIPYQAYPNILSGRIEKKVLIEAFQDYALVFMKPGTFQHTREWSKLRESRNNLIHTGIPVTKDSDVPKLILALIGLDQRSLDVAISHLQSGNLKALVEFEQRCLNNKFFLPLRHIAGITSATHTLTERRICAKYLSLLHS